MILKRLLKDSMIYGGGDFIGRVILFMTFPIIANALSPKSFGVLELIITTTMLISLVVNCGLNNATARFYWDSDTKECERSKVISSGLAALLAFACIALLLSLTALPFITPYLASMHIKANWMALVGAVVLMILQQCQRFLTDVLRLHFAPFKFFIIAVLSNALIATSGIVAVVLFQLGLNGYILAQVFAGCCVMPVALWFARKDLTLKIDLLWTKKLIRYGYPFIFAGIAYWIFGSTDRWILAKVSSVTETGIYSVAFKFSAIAYFAATAFGMAWSPLAIKLRSEQPDHYREIYAQVFYFLLYAMILLAGGVALFAGEIISTLMSPEYAGSTLPLIILCIGVIFQASQQVTAIGISLERKTHLIAHISWLAALTNLILNLIFIPHYGASGAAMATSIAYVVLTGGYLYFTQRLHTLPISWKRVAWLLTLCSMIFFIAFTHHLNKLAWEPDGFKLLALLGYALLGLLACIKKRTR